MDRRPVRRRRIQPADVRAVRHGAPLLLDAARHVSEEGRPDRVPPSHVQPGAVLYAGVAAADRGRLALLRHGTHAGVLWDAQRVEPSDHTHQLCGVQYGYRQLGASWPAPLVPTRPGPPAAALQRARPGRSVAVVARCRPARIIGRRPVVRPQRSPRALVRCTAADAVVVPASGGALPAASAGSAGVAVGADAGADPRRPRPLPALRVVRGQRGVRPLLRLLSPGRPLRRAAFHARPLTAAARGDADPRPLRAHLHAARVAADGRRPAPPSERRQIPPLADSLRRRSGWSAAARSGVALQPARRGRSPSVARQAAQQRNLRRPTGYVRPPPRERAPSPSNAETGPSAPLLSAPVHGGSALFGRLVRPVIVPWRRMVPTATALADGKGLSAVSQRVSFEFCSEITSPVRSPVVPRW